MAEAHVEFTHRCDLQYRLVQFDLMMRFIGVKKYELIDDREKIGVQHVRSIKVHSPDDSLDDVGFVDVRLRMSSNIPQIGFGSSGYFGS